jgi:putative SOS response-associated peptidase YedK
MCGRITLRASGQAIADLFDLAEAPAMEPRYNIAPTQPVLAVREVASGTGRELVTLRWGLIPHWADDPKIGNRLINARAESVATKPAFQDAFRKRRCLIPADGFFEWQKQAGRKQPFYIRLKDGRPFAFAGLWDRWLSPDGEEVETCTVLTTEANEVVRPLHERMPVIVKPDDFARWLDTQSQVPERVQPLLRSYPAGEMTAYPVSPVVNNPRNDSPKCVEAIA